MTFIAPSRFFSFLLAGLMACLIAAPPARAAFETRAGAAYVLDLTTDSTLLVKNADTPLPPASMSKLMTLNMLFEALRDGRVRLDTRFSVSSRAKAMGGSTMFLTEADRPTVEDLIKGIIVQSGNDACVAVAEGLAGTEDAFSRLMNERAAALGMTNSTFANASGWPDPNHRMSMKDLATLASRLITEFPEYYDYFALKEFGYDGRAPQNRFNRNPLLSLDIGADGLKTGHTQEAGYGLVGSAIQGNRRIVFVLTGLSSPTERAEEAERIVNWAFRQFARKTVALKGTQLAEAKVWMGASRRVGLTVAEDVEILVPALLRGEIAAEAVFQTPLRAPIKAGDELGALVFDLPGIAEKSVPLIAAKDVPRGGVIPHLRTAAEALLGRAAMAVQGL